MKILNYIFRFWASILVVMVVLLLSLLPVRNEESIPLFSFADKLVHMIMYLGIVVAMSFDYYRGRQCGRERKILCCYFCFAILLGGLIEIAQGYTDSRSCDMLDFFANCTGAFLGVVLSPLVVKPITKRLFH